MKKTAILFTFTFFACAASADVRFDSPVPLARVGAWSYALAAATECRELSDIPATYLCLTQNEDELRTLMGRVSFFVEGKPARTLVSESDPAYRGSGQAGYAGHDIMAKDYALYYAETDKACPARPELCLNPQEESLRRHVGGDVAAKGYANYAVISVEAGTGYMSEVLSHEVLHARFFLNEKYRARVREYWDNHVSAQDKKLIRQGLGRTYNLKGPDGFVLLLNEFQAYVLQENAVSSELGRYAMYNQHKFREFMGALLP